MKRSFFQTAVMSILLYGCTAWTLTKCMEKKLDSNYPRMLRTILSKSWRQHPTTGQLYGHLPPSSKLSRYKRHCWRSRNELIGDVLLWTPSHGHAMAGRPARTYIQQLCADMGCSREDLLQAVDDWKGWQERVRDIRADSVTWWWWWWFYYIYLFAHFYGISYSYLTQIFCTKLYGIKYSYIILIIYIQLYDFKLLVLFDDNNYLYSYNNYNFK